VNRLATASSAYLRSAAHQPVHWYPWGAEGFAAARSESKPILLDIGAVWCHWCHVMDHESYEDHGLAEFLNVHFVCLKVDRDERPDVDARYQRAVQAMTGQGGWPLTAMLTPEGEVFFGGTYFPPEDLHGRPGLRTVLERVLRAWREGREGVRQRASAIRSALDRMREGHAPGTVGAATLVAGERQMLAAFDEAFGGFGTSPKFPHPTALRFLMTRWADTGSSRTRHVVVETLLAMARGGIHDQLGGGFHRYSVDRQWIIPHFEKMACDNAELLRAYAMASQLFDDPECAATARGVARWIREVLALGEERFGTSQDADTGPLDDGSYFTWTRDEIAAVVDPSDLDLALRLFGVGTLGAMHHDPSRNVLFLPASAAAQGERLGLPTREIERKAAGFRAALHQARSRRPAPMVDRTPYASWNAQLAGALLAAAPVLGGSWASDYALGTLRALRRDGPEPDRLAHASAGTVGLLEDQVFAAEAAMEAYEWTGDRDWLQWAGDLMERTWRDHWTLAGLVDRAEADGEGLLATPVVQIEDAPVPSGNGVAAQVCARLAAHTGSAHWKERQRTIIETFAGSAPGMGLHASAWLLGADWLVHEPTLLVVHGPQGDPLAESLLDDARRAPLPRKVLVRNHGSEPLAGAPLELATLARGAVAPRGLICLGRRCLAPADTASAWKERLAEAAHVARAVS